MKHTKKPVLLLIFSLLLCLSAYTMVYASGNGNIDGGSGGMGSGTKTDVWYNQDGVRITVVKINGSVAASPFDLSNTNVANSTIHFGKVSKLQYTAGASLFPSGGSYSYSKPDISLPRIISGGSRKASIAAIKRYFCSEYAAELVSNKTGIPFNELTGGNYKLVIEPIAYFIHGGRHYAMTATEAALYNQKAGGTLRSKMPSLTHQNLPLSLFLEKTDLGYPAWNGPTSGKVSDSNIISALGIGIVTYKEKPQAELEAPNYTYRVNTDVITSITLSTSTEINPKNPASVTFYIDGRSYTVNNIVIPEYSSQVVWVKWRTPSEPTKLTITASVKGATTAKTSFTAKIVSMDENVPPDPLATDTAPRFSLPSLPNKTQNTSASWSIWSAEWEPNWQWESDWRWISGGHSRSCPDNCSIVHGHWSDYGKWVDRGKYKFTSTSYSASLSGTMSLMPDDIVPTANGKNMKSGYGVKQNTLAYMRSNAPDSHYAAVQTAVSYFPEFKYKEYWRLLTCSGGISPTFQFQPNEFSTYTRNVHFTPVWYPDGTSYPVYTYAIDAWTPAGMLSINLSDSVTIQGSMFDDWYSKRE